MKKLLFVAATLAAMGAHAQSNVSLYGNVDMGVTHSSSDTTTNVGNKTGVHSGGWLQSYVGFKGTENLGNGTKAAFVLEYAIDPAQTRGLSSSREQSLGLETSYGTVKLGRLESADSVARRKFDAQDQTSFSTVSTALGGETYLNSTANYQGKIAGISVGGSVSFDGTGAGVNSTTARGTAATQERGASVNVGYEGGPLAVEYVYSKTNNMARTARDNETHLVGASYDFGLFNVLGSTHKAGDTKVYSAGVRVPVTSKVRVDAGYSYAKVGSVGGNANIYGVQASYDLSKRTMMYAGYQYVDNHKTSFGALGSTFGTSTSSVSNNTDSTGIGAGLKHTF